MNFSITPTSLHAQCLHAALLRKRPSLERRLTSLEKARHRCDVRLHELEVELLDALNRADGNVLEDQALLLSLEKLQCEVEETSNELERTISLTNDADRASALFEPFAKACVSAFFALYSLRDLHHLYCFDLRWFRHLITSVLGRNGPHDGIVDSREDDVTPTHIRDLVSDLLIRVYENSSWSLLERDRIGLALTLSCIQQILDFNSGQETLEINAATRSNFSEPLSIPPSVALLAEFCSGNAVPLSTAQLATLPTYVSEVAATQQALSSNLAFLMAHSQYGDAFLKHLHSHAEEWSSFIRDGCTLPPFRHPGNQSSLDEMVLTAALRPSQLPQTASKLIVSSLGEQCCSCPALDVEKLIASNPSSHLVLMLSSAGYDGAYLVQELADRLPSTSLETLALGSSLVNTSVDLALKRCARSGSWLLLQNLHVLPDLMNVLEKRLHVLMRSARPGFKVFATASLDSSTPIPSRLAHSALVVMLERPTGLKASLGRSWSSISESRCSKAPQERSRLYLLVALLHAMAVERVRYAPVGFVKDYEFSHIDRECALDMVDSLLDHVASGVDHVAPENIPWEAIASLLRDTIYGAKIDDVNDDKVQIISNLCNLHMLSRRLIPFLCSV